jgi:hypothetical protein
MQFLARCGASISKNHGERWVLLVFEEEKGRLHGLISESLGKLDHDKHYRITIEEVDAP